MPNRKKKTFSVTYNYHPVYYAIVNLAMLYGSACWAVDRRIGQSMSVPEMRMLRRTSGVTREDNKERIGV